MSIKIDHIVVGSFYENTYFLTDESGSSIIVDPGGSGEEVDKYIRTHHLDVKMVVNTHGHIDHVEANDYLKEKYNMPILIHPKDAEDFSIQCDKAINDGDTISLKGYEFKVIHTPGHTMGSVCLKGKDFLLTGDTLFAGSIGRTDLGGDMAVMMDTLENRFREIPDDFVLYPGHGNSTTMGTERRFNPYLNRK